MSSISDILNSIDWNFDKAPVNRGVHAVHPYPAKFIAQIAQKLIELFPPGDSSVVLDPFCGSGTTQVEAIKMGFDTWGIDLNPVACLLARVKTTPLPTEFTGIMERVTTKARNQLLTGRVCIAPIPRLDHWFEKDVQKALAALVENIEAEEHLQIREALQIALSSIIVRVSNQESDTRYAAIKKDVSSKKVFDCFEQSASNVYEALSSLSDTLFNDLGQATIINRDILSIDPGEIPVEVGLVVTSPPYPNAYEYWLYHKYRMYWLGMDPVAVREKEIGARPHYFKKNHQDEKDFEQQMSKCFSLLAHVMRKGAKACFLVGRSIIHGRVIDNAALLQRAAKPHGFVAEGIIERRIPSTRKTFNPSYGKIKREHLIVFALETKS